MPDADQPQADEDGAQAKLRRHLLLLDPGALDLVPAFEGSESGIFAVTNSGSGGTLLGITESLEPEALIGEMWAGDECSRVFT